MVASAPTEQTLYESGPVRVTTARAVIGATTYAMANVTSVRHFTEPRPSTLLVLAFLVGTVGVVVLLFGAVSTSLWWLIPAGLLGWLYYAQKPKHWVRIGTAGAEANAIYSPDPEWTRQVVKAMNDAIIARG